MYEKCIKFHFSYYLDESDDTHFQIVINAEGNSISGVSPTKHGMTADWGTKHLAPAVAPECVV